MGAHFENVNHIILSTQLKKLDVHQCLTGSLDPPGYDTMVSKIVCNKFPESNLWQNTFNQYNSYVF